MTHSSICCFSLHDSKQFRQPIAHMRIHSHINWSCTA